MVNGRTYLIADHLRNAFYIGRFDYFKLRKANTKGDIAIKDVITILKHAYNGQMLFFDEVKEISNSHLAVKEITGSFESGYVSVVQAIKYFMLTAINSHDLFKVVDELRSEGKKQENG